MCRMFSINGDFRKDIDAILNSLRDVTRKDPLLRDGEGRPESHPDGWGYVSLSQKSIDYRRYEKPFFKSKMPDLLEPGLLMVHVRKAADGEPLGFLNSHPHHKSTTEYDLYLCHNGQYNKERIASLLGEENAGNQTDSEFFLEYIASRKGTIEEKLKSSIEAISEKDLMKTTSNFTILSIDKNTHNAKIYYYSDTKNPTKYTDLYYTETKKWKGVFSASIPLSKYFPKKLKMKKVPMKVLFELR